MKLVRVLLLVVVTLVPITSVGWAGSALNEILSSGKLLAGTTGDFNPFSIRDAATNKYQGYDIDIMTELANDMEVEIEFVPTDWKTIVNGVVAGKYHITGSASIKASRMKAAGFSESYLSVNFKPFTTADKVDKFNGWDSINQSGVKVATTLGTAMEPMVKAWFPNAEIKSVEAPARGYQEVLSGRADVFVTSNLEGSTLKATYSEVKEISVDAPRAPTPLAMLLPQDDQVWINFVNHWIKIKQAKGFFEATAEKWGL
ncbi:MAG: transporter substrate-binding domain-containing protein [Pseudomonadota bacterium]|nr:transporter substrate-binding domain-containing protein [Pseudomonadota bacterium]